MASGTAPLGAVALLVDPESEVEWLPQVAASTLVYHLLELELPGIAVLVVAVSSEYSVLTFVLPAEIVPWLLPSLVPLGELDTGLPAAAGLRALAASSEETFVLTPEDLQRDWAVALAPAVHAVGPAILDHQLGGALSRGPWHAVMDIPWPPCEPDGEAIGLEDQNAEPAPYLDEDEDEDPDDADFFSALGGPALGDALLAAAMREAQRASASAPPHGLGFAEEASAGAAAGRSRAF